MKLLIINGPAVVPPPLYGGIERMVALLASCLAKDGHDVSVMAGAGSHVPGCRMYSMRLPQGHRVFRAMEILKWHAKQVIASQGADLVHVFAFAPEHYLAVNRIRLPVIYTQQNRLEPGDFRRVLAANPRNGFLQGISRDQMSVLDSFDPSRTFCIPNATDTDMIRPVVNPKGSYLAYLGRLNFEKGVDIAVEVARRSGVPLKIAGIIPPQEAGAAELFETKVRPYLGRFVEYIGQISDKQKSEFLGNAIAMLMPNRWREPFGIVMAEALAAGTPVIGTPLGSIPEVIDDGVTGYLCRDVEEMCEAVSKAPGLDRGKCREVAESRFSARVFYQNTLRMYRSVLATS